MEELKNLIGQHFGKLFVEKIIRKGSWLCKCDCGNQVIVNTYKLVHRKSLSCGCLHKALNTKNQPHKDITGQKFNMLTAIKYAGNQKWLFLCECGNCKEIKTSAVTNGLTKSCGCIHHTNPKKYTKKERLKRIYLGIKSRCYNPNTRDRKSYYDRNIIMCNEWLEDYKNFKRWAMANGYKDDLTIDRIDVNGDYEPSNCRWITREKQALNKTNSRIIEWKGNKKTISEWCLEMNIKKSTLLQRLNKYGWSVERALTTKTNHYVRKEQ